MRSVMRHQFGKLPEVNIPRSQLDLSHGIKTTFDAGYLVPVTVFEVLPGDTVNLDFNGFARMLTPISPIMDNLRMDTHFFFCPNRLVWTNFVKMMGEQDNPDDSIDFTVPTMTAPTAGYGEESLQDYMGIPPGIKDLQHISLPFRMYNLIYNTWYRSENLQDSVQVDKGDGPDDYTNYTLLKRNKSHDYFTSALPWLQKGDALEIPLGTTAPVVGTGQPTFDYTGRTNQRLWATNTQTNAHFETAATSSNSYASWNDPKLQVDLTTATAATVNDFREAMMMQKLLERDARGGTRYQEHLYAHFGVEAEDHRLQLPEYLGGGSTPINFHEVPQTSSTDATTPQGNLAAFAQAHLQGGQHGFVKSFTEHGFIIGLVSVRADLTYQQGLEKFWSRSTRYDFYYPSLANLGEQPIYNREIYAQDPAQDTGSTGTPDNDRVFGYQERHAEYRHVPSKITGQFRSTAAAPLDSWHLSQEFSSLPLLNDAFMQENPPMARVQAVATGPDFKLDAFVKMICARPMPMRSIPGLREHF